ncbi:MAG: phosphatase PAP2 family protein [Pseudomonadota bacterium]
MSSLGRRTRKVFYAGGLVLTLVILLIFDAKLFQALEPGLARSRYLAELGYWLGHGLVQGPLLAAALIIAWRYDLYKLKAAVIDGLLAFVLSGLLSQGIKHLVGRPRPRLWAQGVVHLGPSLADGLDSFPSGHASTSVAVALVLSFWYPKASPVFMGLAAFVAAARILGGSHFPFDVLGGVFLGLGAGWAVISFSRSRDRLASDYEGGRS